MPWSRNILACSRGRDVQCRKAWQVLELRPRFNAIAQSERDAAADRDGPDLPDGDDADTARSMATLFTEAGEAHAIAISSGGSP